MAISPIILNGTIQQTQDVLQNQTKETHKAMLDQGNIFAGSETGASESKTSRSF